MGTSNYQYTWAGLAGAFTIFAVFGEDAFATYAEHDVIYSGPEHHVVSEEDQCRLAELGWTPDEENGHFRNFV